MTVWAAAGYAGDQLAVTDAMLRFAEGADMGDKGLLASAFTANAEVDFEPCGRSLGLEFGVLRDRAAIVGFLVRIAARQVTSHAVTNPRAVIAGDRASLSVLVEAVHFAREEPGARLRMMNRYVADLERDEDRWSIHRLRITNIWFEGDPRTLLLR
ncbi:nuclear transport factor 2 family protein [uncultured Methylobacterium sp.]|uniref:nuclear transport factor 2 family protein n=1 Tax=uncultured Methylobacterium sp. TaxID=157278 RepID=UPI0035CBEB6E